ncbi:unnamed protein product [Acanthoscelides obtectus]|uniref:Major facilitator superfamily (MFS) profile domain-containing protein n=1 Tax=Acanthoscelides obtectus TaxID=200917 RepID=A0A9P0KQM4_ACAOB|nr:unnamed protein product [Acanthoscelides obtectus]CAK1656126.1 Facilitated trehalose transporter Tret1 [Acanthoscelides obtectus]
MAMCVPTGLICDFIGRKKTLVLLFVPFTTGWFLIIFANSVIMLYLGRFITGLASGSCCIVAPLYTSEIAHKSMRGSLGTYFQLMVTIGIFLTYLFGKYLNAIHFTIVCACIPAVFVLIFAFQPESPTYLIKKGRFDDAKVALTRLRGKSYNVDLELNHIEGFLKELSHSTGSFSQTMKQKAVVKAFIIAVALMFYQQFSGINPIILYTTEIFKSSGVNLDPQSAAIIIGAFQVVATFISSLLIDRSGRKVLLITSSFLVTLTTFLLGLYFTFKTRMHIDHNVMEQLGILPVAALCIYIIAYSVGLGPIPWIISNEIFPLEIKSIASSTAATFNWLSAFVLLKFYLQLTELVGSDSTFYMFSGISFTGILFVYFVIPETKGKTISEVKEALENY